MRWKVVAAVLCFVVLAGSCSEPAGPNSRNDARLVVRADVSGTSVAMVVVEVTAADLTPSLTFNIPVINNIAAGTVTIRAGSSRTITLNAYDTGGALTHSGTVTVNVQPGSNPPISVTLIPFTGDLPITVTLGNFGVTVTPSSVALRPGDTVRLTAAIVDGTGNPVSASVAWASLESSVVNVISTGPRTGRATAVAAGTASIVAVYGGVAGVTSVTVNSTLASGPLRVSTANSRYFADPSGRIVYLSGSHTWGNFQDFGTTNPPLQFNWSGYLDVLQQHHHNFIKLWRWEQARWSAETMQEFWTNPMPYMRTGPGLALDGQPKFDLDQFNPAYFARMRQYVIDAAARGIYVSIMLFDAWCLDDKGYGNQNPWHGHPMNRNNNINGVDGDPNNDDRGQETELLTYPALEARQEAYVRQVIDAVNDLDNVLYEISNEETGVSGAIAWQYNMIQYIRQYEAGKPKQHPVGMTVFSPGGANTELFASTADWIAPNGDAGDPIGDPLVADGSKVIIDDTDHLCGVCGDRAWVWKSFTRGRNPVLMDPWDGTYGITTAPYDANDPKWEDIRTNFGYARTYADRIRLSTMTPHGEVTSSGFCLAQLGTEYLVYLPSGSGTVNLTSASGSFTVEWFDPKTGVTTNGGTTTGGATRSFTTPTSGDAVLYLHR